MGSKSHALYFTSSALRLDGTVHRMPKETLAGGEPDGIVFWTTVALAIFGLFFVPV